MNFHRISSPITKIFWAGWESDTTTLQRMGWQISAECSDYEMRYRFALKHPNFRMYGLTESVMFDKYFDNLTQHGTMFGDLPRIVVKYMASRMEINLMDDLTKFQPIDCQPTFVTQERKNIEDFMIFRPIGKVNEIIIAEQDTSKLLDMIISKQSPLQAELREKKRKAWRKFTRELNEGAIVNYEKIEDNRNNIVAQLVTI